MGSLTPADLSVIVALLAYEIDNTNPADGRRVISAERHGVVASTQLYASGRITADAVRSRAEEARRTLSLWADLKAKT